MDTETILTKLGKTIYNHFIESTSPGEPFLLLLDPFEYENIKESTGNRDEIDRALKSTGRLSSAPNEYISIAVASLQVQLIYDIEIEKINDGFYTEMKNYYPNLIDDNAVQSYFKNFQENMWDKVKKTFDKRNLYLQIPNKKDGSGRYVQYPKSQRLIRWKELSDYADRFIRIGLEHYQMLSFSDFCHKVDIDCHFDKEQNEIIKKIVFSFYNNWDGQSTEKLREQKSKQRIKPSRKLFMNSKKENIFDFSLRIKNEKVRFFFDGKEVSHHDVKNQFKDKLVLSFLFDEEYEEWTYTVRPLHLNSRLLVLANKSIISNKIRFKNNYLMETEYYGVYHFEYCDNNIAGFAGLSFVTKEYFSIIGGIRVIGCYHFSNDVLGAWYDFALPKVKIDIEKNARVFIDSKEIVVNNNRIDLADLTLENNEKWLLESREKEYSLKCTNLPSVYFLICGTANDNAIAVENGWKITDHSLRPIQSGEAPAIAGLRLNYASIDHSMEKSRPFISNMDYLQNRFSYGKLNKRIRCIAKRGIYGV